MWTHFRHGRLFLYLSAGLLGCTAPEALPEDLDGLVHYVWDQWDEGEEAELAEVVALLDEAIGGATLDGVYEGSLSSLSQESAAIGGVNRDPSLAQGLFMARDFQCGMERLKEILIALDQDELYPGSYDVYERTYTCDLADWESGTSDRLNWEVQYDSSLLGASYSASLLGGLRSVTGLDPGIRHCDEAIVGRFVMPEAAEFESGSGKSLDLNFQIELFYEREPGRIVHLYGSWQHADLGAGISTEDEGVQNIILSNMATWDDQTERLCAQ